MEMRVLLTEIQKGRYSSMLSTTAPLKEGMAFAEISPQRKGHMVLALLRRLWEHRGQQPRSPTLALVVFLLFYPLSFCGGASAH